MVVHNLDIFRAHNRPAEAKAPLVVHSNAVLSSAVAFRRFESVAWWNAEVFKSSRDLQLSQLTSGNRFDVHESLHALAIR